MQTSAAISIRAKIWRCFIVGAHAQCVCGVWDLAPLIVTLCEKVTPALNISWHAWRLAQQFSPLQCLHVHLTQGCDPQRPVNQMTSWNRQRWNLQTPYVTWDDFLSGNESLKTNAVFSQNLLFTLTSQETLWSEYVHKHTTENSASTLALSHQSHDSGSSSLPEKKLVSTGFHTDTNNKLHHWTGSQGRPCITVPPAG